MNNPDIEEILFRSLTGTATKKDLQQLARWRESHYDNDLAYKMLRRSWEQPSKNPQVSGYKSLEKHIIQSGFGDTPHDQGKPARRGLIHKMAAAVLLLITTSIVFTHFYTQEDPVQDDSQLVITYNPAGQKSKITLPDNSVIFLNSESQVSYQKGFTDSIRYIELAGEAYFEVEPDQTRPFVVETGEISTMALGTSFNIRNYPEENSISVSLLSGEVKVTDNQAANEVYLQPFEHVAISRNTRVLKMTQLQEDNKSIWKDGIITFKASSFNHVIKTLERSYDVDFDVTDYQRTNWRYTGRFDNMSLEIVLTRLGYSEAFKFEIEGRNIVIYDDH